MLPKKKRVTKEVFQNIIKKGKTFSTQIFLFYFIKNNKPQYAFISPKKIFKNAVIRNKYKRIGYNTLRSISITQGGGLFFYKKKAIEVTPQEIKRDIIFLLKKAKLF